MRIAIRKPTHIFFLTVYILLGYTFISPASAGDLKLTLGLGYDYISSQYYLLTVDTMSISEDSLEVLKRSNDAYDELLVIGKAKYKHKLSSISSLEIYNRANLSNQSFRNTLSARLKIGMMKIDNNLNIHSRSETDEESLNQDYISNRTAALIRPHLGNNFYLRVRNSFKMTRYNNPSGYYYNYNFNKLDLSVEKDFGFQGYVRLGYRNDIKQVTDSSRLEYGRNMFLISAEYAPSWNFRLNLENEYSVKDSKKEDQLDDETLENLEITAYFNPREKFGFKFYSEFEYSAYDNQDLVYFDQYYYKTYLELRAKFRPDLTISMIPHYRNHMAKSTNYSSQDFYEYTIEPRVEYNLGMNLWLDISYEYGRRIYPNALEGFFNDHALHQFNLMVDAVIKSNLSFNVLAAIDWENHDLQEDNTRLYLISTAIEYKF
jgi:hypothetical protein